ncbi:MAG: BamA/TamA family outer membrane protein [Candidatus Zixiibacteriota bacterium]
MRNTFVVIALMSALILLAASPMFAVDYKDYKITRLSEEYFEISYDKENVTIRAFDGDELTTLAVSRGSLKSDKNTIVSEKTVLFDEASLVLGGKRYLYEKISDCRITEDGNTVTVTFYSRRSDSTRVTEFRSGNLIAISGSVTVEEGDFIRGIIFSLAGNIEIYGEVNKDIVSILGDIYVGPKATARGDIATVKGRIDVAGEASVYGETFEVDRRGIKRIWRFERDASDFNPLVNISYDRVDGLGLYGGVSYKDPDSLLPSVTAEIGYGFNSERWRYRFDAEQALLRDPAIMVGGSLYRRLATDDSWLLGTLENTTFALLATEDFRDYYEAEGGTLYLKSHPVKHLTLLTGYRFEDTKWLDARRHLWSLFGGSKLFPENFSTVSEPFRTAGISEIDSTSNGSWYSSVIWDTRDDEEPFDHSAWYATADLEWSSDNFNSDFDYRRYTLGLRRYQKINRYAMVISRVMYGGSDGYLPMYKRFFLGGLGTLQGYDHKGFMGTRFWMANLEYRLRFPRVETALALFWDAGQIANETKLSGEIDVKHDLGVAVYFEDDFRISLAKRLDRSYDDNPIFYVRLDHVF